MQRALQLYHILSESNTNLRQPVGLENQLLQSEKDHEVGRSMLQLLQVNSAAMTAATCTSQVLIYVAQVCVCTVVCYKIVQDLVTLLHL